MSDILVSLAAKAHRASQVSLVNKVHAESRGILDKKARLAKMQAIVHVPHER